MDKTHFARGDRVDAMSVAGADFDRYQLGPISADVFTFSSFYCVPILISTEPGSGTLDAFLDALRAALPDKPIAFMNVINQGLRPRLLARGFGIIDLDQFEHTAWVTDDILSEVVGMAAALRREDEEFT